MPNCDLNILRSMTYNKTIDLQENENPGAMISVYSSKRIDSNTEEKFNNLIGPKMNKNIHTSNGNKPGLAELSNDKTYLETEMPLRKRIKAKVELFKKHIQKKYAFSVSDTTKEIKSFNFINNEKCFSEELNSITSKLSSEETSELDASEKIQITENTDLNAVKFKKLPQTPIRKCNSAQNNFSDTKQSSNSIELINIKGEDKSLSDNDIKYADKDSFDGSSEMLDIDMSNNAFDIEVKKCSELLHTNPSGNKINMNIETKITNASFKKTKDNKLTVDGETSVSSNKNNYLGTLKTEKTNSELKLIDKNINTKTIWPTIKLEVNPQNTEEHGFQKEVNIKGKIFEVQSFNKDMNIRKVLCDSENINAVEPKFSITDNSISNLLTSISDNEKGISCIINEFDDHYNKNEKDNTEFGEKNKFYVTNKRKFPIHEDNLLAFNELELSIHENINGKEKDCNDDCEASLLEDDTIFYDNSEILNTKETTDSYKELLVDTKKINTNLKIYIKNEDKAIFVKDSDILKDQSTVMLDCDPKFESLAENDDFKGIKDITVADACKNLIEQNKISTSENIKKQKPLTNEKPVANEKNPPIIENYVSLEVQNTNHLNEYVTKVKSQINKNNTENDKMRIFNVKDSNIMKDQNITTIPMSMQEVKSFSKITEKINDRTKLVKEENNLIKSKISIKDRQNIFENHLAFNSNQGTFNNKSDVIIKETSFNEKNELSVHKEHCLINSEKKTAFIKKNNLSIPSGNETAITDKNVINNMDKIFTTDKNAISEENTVDHDVSFSTKMSSDSTEKVSKNTIKELNSGNKLEEKIGNRFENKISETIAHKSVKENEKLADGEEIKQKVDQIPDYYEDEKEDLIDPGWNLIKNLLNDKERYRQVRDCWKSTTIPNPNKNLTYHSFRKRHLNNKEAIRAIKQHKRQATSNLYNQNTKRSRSCTVTFDNHIQSKIMEKKLKTKELKKEMNDKINLLNDMMHQKKIRLQSHQFVYGNTVHRQNYDSELQDIQNYHQQQVFLITRKYRRKIREYGTQYQSGIEALKKNRKEVFQFYKFYKGLQDEQKDLTILTNDQLQELNEVENIYEQLDNYCK
ncbi:uncharacterized protein TNIN_23461 [Trichonephila inaurata madagascariensis]|uniref:Uncharacterized protein n=1 Tax=Trichonephila inaurata madagascariensis TaxID=2747483 RepID=A0A8X7CH93_9ARAC|nr:uncharacterized protein TNIN_23461 [Trichonephila inaurata madagascariensis]